MGRRNKPEGPNGLLLVDKPEGLTSAAVVARVRRVLGGVKAGHTGTLDPFATGLLPLCLGEGTKLATYLSETDKVYEGIIRLGVCTDTHDRTGEVTATAEVPALTADTIAALATEFSGTIAQVPPVISAIKRGGRPMYQLARRGEAPELEPREVTIRSLELAVVDPERLSVRIECSKGFYVRSLARDIGDRLGCGGLLESLRRTRVGRFDIEEAVALGDLEGPGGFEMAQERILPMLEGVAHLRRVDLTARDAGDLRLGRQGPLLRINPGEPGERIRLAVGNELVAVAVSEGRLWTLDRVFAAPPMNLASCPAPTYVLDPHVSQTEEEERNEANRRD